ncbi:MAG: hypothetical protein PUE18_08170 [Firmicutes bacterium]|nr:hypothetical protein [Bacillota bacterium]
MKSYDYTTKRANMSRENRAKQFAPFAALKGLEEEMSGSEFNPDERRILAEDEICELNQKLCEIQPGDYVSIIHYHKQKYIETKGTVKKTDLVKRAIIVGEYNIRISDIYAVDRK